MDGINDPIKRVIHYFLLKKAQKELAVIREIPQVKDRARTCNLRHLWNPTSFLLTCTVNCGNINHLVEVAFINPDPEKPLLDNKVEVSCDCGDFVFGGPIYNLNKIKTLRNPARYPGRLILPRIRDPHLQKYLCKHLVTAKEFLANKKFEDL